jgi:hypothetical protein
LDLGVQKKLLEFIPLAFLFASAMEMVSFGWQSSERFISTTPPHPPYNPQNQTGSTQDDDMNYTLHSKMQMALWKMCPNKINCEMPTTQPPRKHQQNNK